MSFMVSIGETKRGAIPDNSIQGIFMPLFFA